MQKQPTEASDELLAEIRQIRAELARLNDHKMLRVYASTSSLLVWMFFKGVAFGLGSVVGATLLVSILVYLLGQIEFIPIVGEWVRSVLDVIEQR